ncbi:hypothetical protein M413DRAFT_191254 [Hebeloma cylindrosporum]|uniref:Uncharacterized protein n=1 Tax=Hebeloma cylindrosporum TaxID=76867 RepID=A0A0C3C769_HEBCY|nr:hypothetical protein M413DRAFT_191254 [Hebeloma cylindrosporum h7]
MKLVRPTVIPHGHDAEPMVLRREVHKRKWEGRREPPRYITYPTNARARAPPSDTNVQNLDSPNMGKPTWNRLASPPIYEGHGEINACQTQIHRRKVDTAAKMESSGDATQKLGFPSRLQMPNRKPKTSISSNPNPAELSLPHSCEHHGTMIRLAIQDISMIKTHNTTWIATGSPKRNSPSHSPNWYKTTTPYVSSGANRVLR